MAAARSWEVTGPPPLMCGGGDCEDIVWEGYRRIIIEFTPPDPTPLEKENTPPAGGKPWDRIQTEAVVWGKEKSQLALLLPDKSY